jgi:tetratricopeptide (TPR) repeat protein
MDNSWHEGLTHYYKGNYYAAKELWQIAYAQAGTESERARCANSLGVAIAELNGPAQARAYYERALAICDQEGNKDGLRIKYMTNLAVTLLQLDHIEDAVKLVRSGLPLITKDSPEQSAVGFSAFIYTFLRGELHEEVLSLESTFLELIDALPEGHRRAKLAATIYHNFAHCASAMGQVEQALHYYLRAFDAWPLPETMQAISRAYLFQGDVEEAMMYMDEIYDDVWNFALDTRKAGLAGSLVLIGGFAYYAGHQSLFERCLDKADLYFGQLSWWTEWLNLKKFESTLGQKVIQVPSQVLDWSRWQAFLDDLSLMDGLETMFPAIFRMALLASELAERIAQHLDIDVHMHSRRLQTAGRMQYLGLTALCATEQEAKDLLRTFAAQAEICGMSAKLLEAYPHSIDYRDIVRLSRNGPFTNASSSDEHLAQCLGIAFDFVEEVELTEKTHQAIVTELLEVKGNYYNTPVLEAFAAQCGLDD